MSGQLFVVSAASGTGKTSLVKALLAQTNNLHVSISHTTRAPRPGEINGVHYHYIDKLTFEDKIQQSQFIEYAEVFGNYYGTNQNSVLEQLRTGADVLLEIDWQGALQVKKIFSNAILIFIVPPSREALRERLSNRGQDSNEVIEHRLSGALHEMQQHVNFDYLVINDDFETAKTDLQSIVLAERCRMALQVTKHQALLENLLL